MLAKEDVKADVEHLKQQEQELAETVRRAKRQSVAAKISKLRPGGSRKLAAVRLENGEVVSEPAAIVQALQRHWQQTLRS